MRDGHSDEPYVLCSCCKEKTYKVCSVFIVVLGLTCVGLAVFLPPAIDQALDDALTQQVLITAANQQNNDDSYRTWSDPTDPDSPPVYYRVYLWNTTNPYDVVHDKTAAPRLTEHGPYVYREYKQRFNVSFDIDDQLRHTMSYRVYTYYIFQRDMTDMSLDPDRDLLYSVNMPFQTLVPQGPGEVLGRPMVRAYVETNHYTNDFYLMWGERPRTPTEILFGYNDTEMWWASIAYPELPIPALFPGVIQNDTSLDAAALDTAGHPYFTVYTGEETWNRVFMRTFSQWQEQDYLTTMFLPLAPLTLPVWRTTEANRVRGTDGYQFQRNVAKGGTLAVFVDELYRCAPLINADPSDFTSEDDQNFYVGTNHIKGISLLRYTMSHSVVQNCSTNPLSCAYDMFGRAGLSNLTIPRSANLFISKPHFMDGDVSLYTTNVIGMTPPVRELHDTYVDIEPLTGIPMNAAKRLQGNIQLASVPTIFYNTWLKNVNPNTMLPIFWVEEAGVIPDHLANQFVGSVYLAQSLSLYMQWVGYFAGASFVVIGFALVYATPVYFPYVSQGDKAIINQYAAAPVRSTGGDLSAQPPVSYDGMNDGGGVGGGAGGGGGDGNTQLDVTDD